MKGRRSIVENLLLVTLLGALLLVLHGLESTFAKGPTSANKGAENKITLCYKPGTPTEKTISVSANALVGHLAHGDLEGPCVLIDAHSQFDIDVEPEKVIDLVLQGGISQIILGRRRGRSAGDLLSLASSIPTGSSLASRPRARATSRIYRCGTSNLKNGRNPGTMEQWVRYLCGMLKKLAVKPLKSWSIHMM